MITRQDVLTALNEPTIKQRADAIMALIGGSEWVSMESAPKGGGAELVTDDKWVDPPKILLLFVDGYMSVGYWDWCYAEGGNCYSGRSAWIEPVSGEQLCLSYDEPIGWMLLPPKET